MDILKTAQHQAGMHVAVFWVIGPLMAAGAIVLFVVLYTKIEWVVFLLLGIEIAIIPGVIIAYLRGRKNPTAVLQKLQEMLRVEKLVLSMHEKSLADWQNMLNEIEKDYHSYIEITGETGQGLGEMEKLLQQCVEEWKTKISESQRRISEIQKHLQ